MAAKAKHRDKIVRTAARLFRRDGYAATGTNDIVAASGAPKGSLYHYFPAGKAQIAAEAVAFAAEKVTQTLRDLAGRPGHPADAVRAYGALLAGWMERSGFRDGCPITTILLELAPAEAAVTAAGQAAFDGWTAIFAATLTASGVRPGQARALSVTAIAAFEGALILARTAGSVRPIEEVTAEIARLFELTAAPQFEMFPLMDAGGAGQA